MRAGTLRWRLGILAFPRTARRDDSEIESCREISVVRTPASCDNRQSIILVSHEGISLASAHIDAVYRLRETDMAFSS